MDLSSLQNWRGRQISEADVISARQVSALSATLDRADPDPQEGDALPDLWHWMFFNTVCRQSELGIDGHPARGGFLPPIALPRRMWAGGQLDFLRPFRVGDLVRKTSTLSNVEGKIGRSGSLLFVEVQHVFSDAAGELLRERQDIVYREAPVLGADAPEPMPASNVYTWCRTIAPDPIMLFRYSALTFNSHRIHYDKPYATQEEFYPDLVVHGPLLATLLMDLLRREMPASRVRQFAFKARRPTFLGNSFQIFGKLSRDASSVELWSSDHQGYLTMSATAQLA